MYELQFFSLLCSSLRTLGKLPVSKLETLHAFMGASVSQPVTSLAGPPQPSSLMSPLTRHCGCPDLASLTPCCRQRHRQPLGGVSPSISRGWQASGPHPALPAAGTQEWLWVGGKMGRGLTHAQMSSLETSPHGYSPMALVGGGPHCPSGMSQVS